MATAVTTPEVTVANTVPEIDAAIAKENAAAAPVVVAPVVPPVVVPVVEDYTLTKVGDGVEIKYSTGEVFKGKDEAEATKNALKSAVKTTQYAKELKTKLDAAAPPPVVQAPIVPAEDAAAAFLMETLSKSLGVSPDELKSMVKSVKQSDATQTTNRVVMQFMKDAPDFPNTPETFDKLGKYMDENGIALTPGGMYSAHLACAKKGIYTPLTPEQIQATTQGIVTRGVTSLGVPPPVVSTATNPAEVDYMKYDINTPLEQVDKAIVALKTQK